MATLLEKTQQIMKMVEDGQFVEGMEEFYAEDVVNIEGDGTRTEGKATLIANEKAFLEKVTAYHGAKIGAVASAEDDGEGNGVTFAKYSLDADLTDGKFTPDQVQVSRWRDGKVVEVRFYYDPRF